jgi:hypothetical protein
MTLQGKIEFVDYGSDDFSTFADRTECPHTDGFWFLIGIRLKTDQGVLYACDAENFANLLRDAECCRLSQLHGREVVLNGEKRKVEIVK